MLKVGMAHLVKAKGFHGRQNWVPALHYGELAATKLKQLKDRRLETVQLIDEALGCKFDALTFMNRHREAMVYIKECYTLWAMNHMRNPGSIRAALSLIQSCLHNDEYEDAERYARHVMFMIAEMTDNFIPSDQRSQFLADGSYWLARAIHGLAKAGGIPQEEEQKAGQEAIALAHKAIELHTQLHAESAQVACAMTTLADVLNYFKNIDDDEVFRLLDQANVIFGRVEGRSSVNVAVGEYKLGIAYHTRARRAEDANDSERMMANLVLALPHFRVAARLFRVNNHVDKADQALCYVTDIEEFFREIEIDNAEAVVEVEAEAATRG